MLLIGTYSADLLPFC